MHSLTEEQRAAVEATEQHVAVEAGPGTGKSTVLADRAAYLIQRGCQPRDILVLTFTRSGAASVRRKVQEATGQEPRCDTFDSYAHALLRDAGRLDGLQVATEFETETAIRGLYEGTNRLPKGEHVPISRLKKALVDWQSGKRSVQSPEAGAVATLQQRLQEIGRVGLFDLAPMALEQLHLEPGQPDGATFEHVLVDERQDVTANEEEMAIYSGVSTFAVGDRAQCVMCFRGAMDDGFECLKPVKYRLTKSFRFGPEIAEVVNVVGRRIGVADVEGMGEKGDVTMLANIRNFLAGPEALHLAPTNIACADLALRNGAVHARRDAMMDPLGGDDAFDLIREQGKAAVSTIHQARGRQARTVVAWGLESVRDDRLAYVALSRAQRHLVVIEGA